MEKYINIAVRKEKDEYPADPPHSVESELAEALFRLSFGKLTYEQAAEKAKEAAPKFDVDDEMLAYKGISWYAKELLKKM